MLAVCLERTLLNMFISLSEISVVYTILICGTQTTMRWLDHLASKSKFAYAPSLMIIPDHYLEISFNS